MYRTIKGFENLKIMRPAYAIEYDCNDPTQLYPTLEFKKFPGLFGAGQFNGSSGYEEAAAQGLVAGINAALKIHGKKPLIFERSNSYIGTMIDDMITKGVTEPYRMLTSRSEHRLFLRQDNAEERILPIGRRIGLISDALWEKFLRMQEQKKFEFNRVKKTFVKFEQTDEKNFLSEKTAFKPKQNGNFLLFDLLKRPEISYNDLTAVDTSRPDFDKNIFEKVETEVKYEGYINRQNALNEKTEQLESRKIPNDIEYSKIRGLRLEAAEKLEKIRPLNLGQASRISGVNPADISVLMIWMFQKSREKRQKSN
jgi:tRNA uridine 5-carboxymethylaminomethyl modification enzyme